MIADDNMLVLIVDDDPVSLTIMTGIVTRAGYRPLQAKSAEKAYELIKSENQPVCVLLDWLLPGMNGPSLCEMIRNTDLPFEHHIIIVTSINSPNSELLALEVGADDFIQKPIDNRILVARLKVAKRQLNLQRLARRQVEQLESRMLLDPVLDVPNELAAKARLKQELARLADLKQCAPGLSALAVAFVINNFHDILDSMGSTVAEMYVQALAERLRGLLASYDPIARIDEDTLFSFKIGMHRDDQYAQFLTEELSNRSVDIGSVTIEPDITAVSHVVNEASITPAELLYELIRNRRRQSQRSIERE